MPTIEESVLYEVSSLLDECGFDRSARIAVAFSGGSDSLALLVALVHLLGSSCVFPLYVNHGLRSAQELDGEISLNRKNCERLGLVLTVLNLPEGSVAESARLRGSGIEDAARLARYAKLEEACLALDCCHLATAHNADDQMETILKRVFQGSSIASLEGIVRIQSGFSSPTTILRPTLGLTHALLQKYVEEKGFLWSEDSTNQMECYERNAIRKNLSPAIISLYPQAHAGIGRLTSRAREVSHLLDRLTSEAMKKVILTDGAQIALDDFLALDGAIRDTVLLGMFSHIAVGQETRLSYAKVRQVRTDLEGSGASSRWSLSSAGMVATLSQGVFSLERVVLPFSFCLSLDTIGDQGEVELESGAVFRVQSDSDDPLLLRIAQDGLVHPLLRSPMEGDRIELEGKTVLLSKLFSEWKIFPALHKQVPVLEDVGGIVAVFGRFLGGKDRLCTRSKTPLAGRTTNIYSVSKRNESSETYKRRPRQR
ncbi:MAG: tRNA lysidine(34) synthetase TilS [Sphaerochaeta sp.]|nr:tRNA lysidine(34) synthetase TilS [Sphaerochaeta sp.]